MVDGDCLSGGEAGYCTNFHSELLRFHISHLIDIFVMPAFLCPIDLAEQYFDRGTEREMYISELEKKTIITYNMSAAKYRNRN